MEFVLLVPLAISLVVDRRGKGKKIELGNDILQRSFFSKPVEGLIVVRVESWFA
jgi:hypothetical protein